jgi:phosphoadenosine phosphosulfate reductase
VNEIHRPIWRDGAFHEDTWTYLQPEEALPAAGEPVLVPAKLFLAEPERFVAYNGMLGVELLPGDSVAGIAPYLWRLSLIALAFPKFSDGRNYSAARLLRERHGYTGELRAVGEVLSDQIPLMRRCGILSYAVTHAPTRAALLAGTLAEVRHYTSPSPPSGSSRGNAGRGCASRRLRSLEQEQIMSPAQAALRIEDSKSSSRPHHRGHDQDGAEHRLPAEPGWRAYGGDPRLGLEHQSGVRRRGCLRHLPCACGPRLGRRIAAASDEEIDRLDDAFRRAGHVAALLPDPADA